MWYRSELKAKAKELLQKNYWKAVLVALILAMITGSGGSSGGSASSGANKSFRESGDYPLFLEEMEGVAQEPAAVALISGIAIGVIIFVLVVFAVALLLSIMVFNPLQVGAQKFFINCNSDEEPSLNALSYAFSNSYKNVIKIMFFRGLYIFLWTLLFIIPGIIKAYEYMMIPYILAENPDMPMEDVFERTKAMMDGEKWRTFVLDLSFLGWHLLGACTCCVLTILYVNPYYYLTLSELYLVLKQKIDGPTGGFNSGYQYQSTTDIPQQTQNPYLQ